MFPAAGLVASRKAGLAAAVAFMVLAASWARAEPIPALAERIAARLDSPSARRAVWGLLVVDAADGAVRYSHNAETLFVPASNAKLFTTALGLSRLGPDYRYTTSVVADGGVQGGVVRGPLRLVGGGDPNLSSRVLPYQPKIEYREDRLAPIRELARQVVEAGVRRVEGDIVGDDTRYVWDPQPSSWSVEDLHWDYGAPASALSLNDNRIEAILTPGPPGQPARVRLRPALDYYDIRNRTRTGAGATVAKRLEARVRPGERAVDLWGEISARSPGRAMNLAVDEPALFAAVALKAELEAQGVAVEGQARAEHRQPWDARTGVREHPAPLAAIVSPPLTESLAVINKASQNLHAEMLLREVGYARRGDGSAEAGIDEMRAFLRELGLSPWEFFLNDASGLSRTSLVSPEATVKLLRAMGSSELRDVFLESLAVGGEDGTLEWRFSKTAAKGRIRAKTGTLTHVTALSGYATALDGRELVFSVFVNNFGLSTSYIRKIVDEILVEIVMSADEPSMSLSGGE